MLVLTRKAGQGFLIGDNVEITLLEVQGDQIRIGIKAPKTIKILRKELYNEIEQANREAAIQEIDLQALKKALGDE